MTTGRLDGQARPAGDLILPWLIWLPAAAFFFYAFLHRVAPSVMVDQIMRDFTVGAAVAGNLSAFYFYAYMSLQVPAGLLYDRYGLRQVLGLAALLCTGGSLIFTLAQDITVLYLGRLLVGAGAAFGFVGCLKLATLWFPANRFTRISGLTMTVGMVGGLAGQAPLAALVDAIGWRPALMGVTAVGLAIAAAVWLTVRNHEGQRSAVAPGQGRSILKGLGHVLGRRQNWALCVIGVGLNAPLLGFAALWAVPWTMQVYDMARAEAAGMVSILFVGWMVGAPLFGAVSDRLERGKPLFVAGIAATLVAVSILLYGELPAWALPILYFLVGLFQASCVIVFGITRKVNPVASAGVALALVNMCNVSSGALVQPLIGWFLDLGWEGALRDGAPVYSAETFAWAFAVLPALVLTALVAALFISERVPEISEGGP